MTHRTDECCEKCEPFKGKSCRNKSFYNCDCLCHTPHTPSSDWERSMSLGDMAEIYEAEGLLGIQKLHESIIHTHIENARREERKRCGNIAWEYIVEATRKESWSRDELLQALTNKES